MAKDSRRIGAALRKLKKAKTPGDSLRILAELRTSDPETYRAIQNKRGN